MPTPFLVNELRGRLWDDESEFDKDKDKSRFRDYETACDRVKTFYKEQHGECHSFVAPGTVHYSNAEKQTMAFNIKARVDFKNRKRAHMSVWAAIELLNTLVDESDPDVSALFRSSSFPIDNDFFRLVYPR